MKGTKSRYALFLILSSLLIPLLNFTSIPPVKGAEQVFFEENFENYNVGTFPSSGGWELWYNGAGTEHQIIVGNISVSPTKSLKLLGLDYWAGFAAKRFTSTSSTIGFEVAVRVEENNGQPRDDARVAFTTKVSGCISHEYAPVTFQDSGIITSGSQVLQSYVADKWYKIKVIMNRDKEAYSVWVDGELKGENLAVTTTSGNITDYPSYEIEAFSVSQCYNSVTAYFDDVRVFEASEVNPGLELVPNKGIETTTLVGSGFAPNSKISVTWDGAPIPTVPSPLITDGYGNFTATISVLNQPDGIYTVKAVDRMGNEATATFTVTLGSPSQAHITVPDDYPTIQEAINQADDGDTIVVKAGTYYEVVNVYKRLNLTGIDYPVIDSNESRSTIMITADGVTLQGFNVTNCGYSGEPYGGGIELSGVENCVIAGNIAYENKRNGISLTNSNYNTIKNNICLNNTESGIRIWSRSPLTSSNNLIKNNTCAGSKYGIDLWSYIYMTTTCNDNTITGNNCFSNSYSGIHIAKSKNCLLSENVLSQNSIGLHLEGHDMITRHIIATNNRIFENNYGLVLSGSGLNEVTIIENIIENNIIGVSDRNINGVNPPDDVVFYHNNFIQNGEQVGRCGKNIWDNGYPSGGNYWSDYNGVDYDGDGIGDVPYIIDENNRDNYPLMSPNRVNPSPSYQITIDTVPPNITDVSQAPVSINGTLEEGVRITATVTDAASEVERVALKYSYGNGTWVTVEMTKLEGDVWDGIIPAFPHGTNVTYTIIAEDKAGNTVTTEELSGAPDQYEVLPEFPLWIILPLFLVATASALVVRKRLSIPAFAEICNRLHRLLT